MGLQGYATKIFNRKTHTKGILVDFHRGVALHRVWGRAIGKGIDFPDIGICIKNGINLHNFGIKNGINLHNFGIKNGINFPDFGMRYKVGYTFSKNWYKVRYTRFLYKKLVSGHSTKSFLISHEILSILVLKVS